MSVSISRDTFDIPIRVARRDVGGIWVPAIMGIPHLLTQSLVHAD